jgi:hypothetical protein
MPELTRQKKITFGEMRAGGVRGLGKEIPVVTAHSSLN